MYAKLRTKLLQGFRRGYWILNNRDGQQTLAFILGCQRSGTTMLRRLLQDDFRVRTFKEFGEITVDSGKGIRLRPLDEVTQVFNASPEPLIIAKPLVESHRASELLEYLLSPG